jgi:4-diphosphocytidyl-2-C-methyl-D-erythritol kinase
MMVKRIRSNAKVNLFLQVMGLRHDGYHEVETILHGVKLADEIVIRTNDEPRIEVDMRLAEGLDGDVPEQEQNLAYIAARAMIEKGATEVGAHIDILKRIPIAAGLGGGSGNAAGILVILNEMWELGIDEDELLDVAAGIGSDVPFCIGGGTALAKARGEQLTRIPGLSDMWFVLGVSDESLSTRDVYAAWDELGHPSEVSSASITMALGGRDGAEVASLLYNDLEPIVFQLRPELEDKKRALMEAGSFGASLSGSGPTLYGVAGDEVHARKIAGGVEDAFDKVIVVRSQPECIERLD